ncbi:hypothetical protein K1719_030937 [Acacia pycnantha]|nr:hypothetical protein K1719_030937 [Acacia pycnantha]
MAQKRYIVEVEKAKEAATPSFGPVYRSLFAKDGFRPPIEGLDGCWDVFRCLSNSVAKLQYSRKYVAIFKDPFRGGNNILVVCDSYTPAGEPIPTNKRHRAALELILVRRVLITVVLGQTSLLAVIYQMLTTRLAYMLELNISGTNGEWEYQVGPSVGIEAGDHIWCSRYILERITEQAGVVLSLDPKPIEVL